jgi:hypothetical protein
VIEVGPTEIEALPNASDEDMPVGWIIGTTLQIPSASADAMPVGVMMTGPGMTEALPNASALEIPVGLIYCAPIVTLGIPNASALGMPELTRVSMAYQPTTGLAAGGVDEVGTHGSVMTA